MRPISRIAVWAFVIFVVFLGLYGLFAPVDGPALHAGIFPEILTPFTLRAFGAFYLSLGLAAITLLTKWSDANSGLNYGYSAYGLIVFISVAFIVYWPLFDIANHPFQLLYPGVYFAVGIPVLILLFRHGTGTEFYACHFEGAKRLRNPLRQSKAFPDQRDSSLRSE
jgi:hypothetical protein